MSNEIRENGEIRLDHGPDGVPTRNGKGRPMVLPDMRIKGFEWGVFSATEQRILVVLCDGEDHNRSELIECLLDAKVASNTTLNHHISNVRQKLRMIRHDIVCVNKNRKYYYRWVRKLMRPDRHE